MLEISKDLRKLGVVSVSALMLLGVGAGVSSAHTNVHADKLDDEMFKSDEEGYKDGDGYVNEAARKREEDIGRMSVLSQADEAMEDGQDPYYGNEPSDRPLVAQEIKKYDAGNATYNQGPIRSHYGSVVNPTYRAYKRNKAEHERMKRASSKIAIHIVNNGINNSSKANKVIHHKATNKSANTGRKTRKIASKKANVRKHIRKVVRRRRHTVRHSKRAKLTKEIKDLRTQVRVLKDRINQLK